MFANAAAKKGAHSLDSEKGDETTAGKIIKLESEDSPGKENLINTQKETEQRQPKGNCDKPNSDKVKSKKESKKRTNALKDGSGNQSKRKRIQVLLQ